MAKLLWAIPCKLVLTDKFSNSASYMNAVEEMHVGSDLPEKSPEFVLGTLWKREREGEEISIRISIRGPDGKIIAKGEFPGLAFSTLRHRFEIAIPSFPISEMGTHTLRLDRKVSERWRKQAEIVIEVIHPETG